MVYGHSVNHLGDRPVDRRVDHPVDLGDHPADRRVDHVGIHRDDHSMDKSLSTWFVRMNMGTGMGKCMCTDMAV